jgi:hypothetical protein
MERLIEHALARRGVAIDGIAKGHLSASEALDLIGRDTRRLTDAAMRESRKNTPRRARWLWVKVRPQGWSVPLSLPMPLSVVRAALNLAARRQERSHLHTGLAELDLHELGSLIESLPRCGRLLQVHDQGQMVEIWLT